MNVVQLWRYPVKSLQGEQLDSAHIGRFGIEGDWAWAIEDVATGFVLTARREPELLWGSARLGDDGEVLIHLADGSQVSDDRALSDWLGRPVRLVEASARSDAPRFEAPVDFEDESAGDWLSWEGPETSFHDSARTQVSIISTASLRGWDHRRFRSNVVVDGGGEDDLVGQTVTLGEVRLEVVKPIGRCVMTTRPQPDGIDRDLDVLRTINRERAGNLAVGARVAQPGTVHVGDGVYST